MGYLGFLSERGISCSYISLRINVVRGSFGLGLEEEGTAVS